MTDAFKILSAALDEAIDDAKNPTLPRVPRKLSAFDERRQIEAKALRKLRHPARSKKLRDFL